MHESVKGKVMTIRWVGWVGEGVVLEGEVATLEDMDHSKKFSFIL